MRRCLLIALLATAAVAAEPDGLLFWASFDKLSAHADFSAGDGRSSLTADLGLRSVEGVKGAGLLQVPGERCSYPLAGNFKTAHGTFVIWVKPLNWDGQVKKFRHFLALAPRPDYRMMIYLYPIGDETVMTYIQNGQGREAPVYRAGAPVDYFKEGEWTQVATTWDGQQVKLYFNGLPVGEGRVAQLLPEIEEGLFTVCPIQFWQGSEWSDPDERTICDEVRVYDHPLTDEQILDLYAAEVPGGLELEPGLAVELTPRYEAKELSLAVRPKHLDAIWRERLAGATVELRVTAPDGQILFGGSPALAAEGLAQAVPVGDWQDGTYRATASWQTLRGAAELEKPPTPWLPADSDWRADRVLAPWTPLQAAGNELRYWNGQWRFDGPFPATLETAPDLGPVLAGPIRLVTGSPVDWTPARIVEDLPQRVSYQGTGTVGSLRADYQTLVEFDGLCRVDLTLTPPAGGAEISALAVEIPLPAKVAQYYRNPTSQEWDGQALEQAEFLPYGWLGNEQRGLSWFAESEANQRRGEAPAWRLERRGDQVVVRLNWIAEPTQVTVPLTYTIGFEPTPVRPLDPERFEVRFAGGPQVIGSNTFVYGWGQQISELNGRLLAHDPAKQRKLVDDWRAADKHPLSYTCAQCTANLSPEYKFFGAEWSAPYGPTFSGYTRVGDDAPYALVGVCPRSTFSAFLAWCVEQHLANDWGDGIYTDIDGATPCDNAAHGCGVTDVFGATYKTWPLYVHRALSRRIYASCRDRGLRYYSHAHSNWYAPFNAFNDGWCPGEQYSSQVMGKPSFYLDEIPERVWRSEFSTLATGVTTFVLPELGRLGDASVLEERFPSESCLAAAMFHGVPLWLGGINRQVVEEVWAVQIAFGMREAVFEPAWSQTELSSGAAEVPLSFWRRGDQRLMVLLNRGASPRAVKVTAAEGHRLSEVSAAWNAAIAADGTVTVPAKSGCLLRATVTAVD